MCCEKIEIPVRQRLEGSACRNAPVFAPFWAETESHYTFVYMVIPLIPYNKTSRWDTMQFDCNEKKRIAQPICRHYRCY
jgi:hypothetical protein